MTPITSNGQPIERDAFGLSRRIGLSNASVEFVKMLAAIAVERYLSEAEAHDEEQK